jgi:hypothetical protein
VPGELVGGKPADQHLCRARGRSRCHEVAGAAGSGKADHCGGQSACGFLIGGKTPQDSLMRSMAALSVAVRPKAASHLDANSRRARRLTEFGS